MTVAEVATILKLNQQTVRNWIDDGKLPAIHVGRRVRVKRSDFERLIVGHGLTSSPSDRYPPRGVPWALPLRRVERDNWGNMRAWRSQMLGVLVLALLIVSNSSALAARQPTSNEKRAILQHFQGSPYPAGWARLAIRVSTVDHRWAAVYIRATKGHFRQVQPDAASLYHTQSHGWVIHQIGNGGGCGLPRRVRADLQLYCV
jgi:excisionase family DNA binding protein